MCQAPPAAWYDSARMAASDRIPLGRRDALAAALLFLAALLPRILYVLEIDAAGLGSFLRLDPLYYNEWARRIAAGDWLGSGAFEMAPLYPYALGSLYSVFGEGLTLPRILQGILGAATCSGTFLLARRLFGWWAGLIAGGLLACYGPAIYYDGQINKTTMALALSLAFAGLLTISEARRRAWITAGGACVGLAALVHENVNVAVPILLVWLLVPRAGETWKVGLPAALLFMAGYAAAVLPVTMRNVAVSGEYVLITSAGGENFYTGNNPAASGRYNPPPFVRPDPFLEHEDFRVEAARRLGRPVTRREASRYWWGEGLRFIKNEPGRFVWLLWDKLAVFLNAFERPDNFSYANFRLFSRTLSLPWAGFALVAPLAALGLVASAGRWKDLVPLYAGMGVYVLSALIFFTQSRYRMPAIPILAIFAGHGAERLAAWVRQRRVREALLGSALLAGCWLFVTRDPGNAPGFHAQNDAILGELYLHAGRFDEAAESFRRGLTAMEPAARAGNVVFTRIAGAASHGLGLAERERGDLAAAEKAFRAAAACPDPDIRREALRELISLLEARGDRLGAAAALGESVALEPRSFALRLRYARALYLVGRLDESLSQLRSALAASPPPSPDRQSDAWYGMAMVHAARGDVPDARSALDRALALAPGHAGAAALRDRLVREGGGP